MDRAHDTGTADLANLLEIARAARHAGDEVELDFIAVNGSHALAPYRQAVLFIEGRGVAALSGVVQVEANAPYVQWLGRIRPQLQAGPVAPSSLDSAGAAEWHDWLPEYGLWLPFAPDGSGLLFARDIPWLEHELVLLAEWVDTLAHCYQARRPVPGWGHKLSHALLGRGDARGGPWWKRRATKIGAALLLVLLVPVRLTVLAPGELVPLNPAVIRAPLDGVIARFIVSPNQAVKKGDPLFDFDEGQLQSRYAVASQSLATAEAEYRQSAQQALTDNRAKGMLSVLQGKIEERRAESDFLRGQSERAHVLAPRDGIALFDDPSEWAGRPVATGERIMRVAAAQETEVEAWLPIGDAIPLSPGAPVELYLAVSPLSPVSATLRYMSYEAVLRPDASYAYRVRATLSAPTAHRVGLKGTAKLAGERVPLAYWMVRRPLAAIRQYLGW
ncbi:MAG: HlyD family efflux transporter periplasmic adaptor subunit [Massilia sp.]